MNKKAFNKISPEAELSLLKDCIEGKITQVVYCINLKAGLDYVGLLQNYH